MSKVSSQKSLQTSLHKNLPCKGVKWEAGPLGLGPGLLTYPHACIHPSIIPALSITIHFAITCIFSLWIIDLILFGWTTMNASSRYSKG
jgi:hypothetical protein